MTCATGIGSTAIRTLAGNIISFVSLGRPLFLCATLTASATFAVISPLGPARTLAGALTTLTLLTLLLAYGSGGISHGLTPALAWAFLLFLLRRALALSTRARACLGGFLLSLLSIIAILPLAGLGRQLILCAPGRAFLLSTGRVTAGAFLTLAATLTALLLLLW